MKGKRPPRIKQKPPEERATPAEVRARIETARTYLSLGRPRSEVYRKLHEDHGLNQKQAELACIAAMSEIRSFYKLPKADHQALQLERLTSLRLKAEAKGKLNDALKAEAQIAHLLGTNAPTRLSVDVPEGSKERLVDLMMVLPGATIGAILSGDQRVPLGHGVAPELGSGDEKD